MQDEDKRSYGMEEKPDTGKDLRKRKKGKFLTKRRGLEFSDETVPCPGAEHAEPSHAEQENQHSACDDKRQFTSNNKDLVPKKRRLKYIRKRKERHGGDLKGQNNYKTIILGQQEIFITESMYLTGQLPFNRQVIHVTTRESFILIYFREP